MAMEKRKAGRPSRNNSRKTEILEKAAYCFTIKGYNETTLDEIGDSLGFNKAALYYYFKNKEDLFTQVINFERNRLWSVSKEETNSEQGFENKIIKYLIVRSEILYVLIKLNELSKLNLLELTPGYIESNVSFREQEIDFLAGIFSKLKTKHSTNETRDFINLLLSVQASVTMSNILLKELPTQVSIVSDLKTNKIKVLKYLLHSYMSEKT